MPPARSDAFFWLAVAVCAIAQVAILRSALATHQGAVGAEGSTLPPLRRAVEVAWTVVPALALAVLLVFTWRAIHPPVRPAAVGSGAEAAAAGATGPTGAAGETGPTDGGAATRAVA